jgi:hypothetical protein
MVAHTTVASPVSIVTAIHLSRKSLIRNHVRTAYDTVYENIGAFEAGLPGRLRAELRVSFFLLNRETYQVKHFDRGKHG